MRPQQPARAHRSSTAKRTTSLICRIRSRVSENGTVELLAEEERAAVLERELASKPPAILH